jgi:thiamine kinase-like enzyme
MLLTETNIIHYLFDRGLVDASSFIKGNFSCRSGQNRHTNFIINKEYDAHRFFIKQAITNAEKSVSLRREGLFYELVSANEPFQGLQKYLPEILLLDIKNSILIVEWLGEYINLHDWLMSGRAIENTERVATELTKGLYSLHSITDGGNNELKENDFFYEFKPWILRLPEMKTGNGRAARSEAEDDGLKLIFSIPGFVQLIEQAAKLWEPSCIIHGDCKLNNFLLKQEQTAEVIQIKLIDWELVNTGDPLWDLATVFQSVLTAWVISEDPLFKSTSTGKAFDISSMQQFISVCWKKYAELQSWDSPVGKTKFDKCTSLCALRLLHSCFETTPGAKSLRPYSARLLQLAHNILSNPVVAGEQLLGVNMYV